MRKNSIKYNANTANLVLTMRERHLNNVNGDECWLWGPGCLGPQKTLESLLFVSCTIDPQVRDHNHVQIVEIHKCLRCDPKTLITIYFNWSNTKYTLNRHRKTALCWGISALFSGSFLRKKKHVIDILLCLHSC